MTPLEFYKTFHGPQIPTKRAWPFSTTKQIFKEKNFLSTDIVLALKVEEICEFIVANLA